MMTAEDLRYAILQIAMQGKLVKQNVSEGSGHIEYAKMRKHRQQLLKEKKIKKDKELLEISEDELAFDIPENWKFVRVGEVGSWSAGATPSRSHLEYYDGDIPWLKTGDLNDGYITEVPEFITEAGVEHSSVRLNPVGSVLMAMYDATIGKLGILEIEATTNQACCACICYDGMYNKYLFYYLLSQRKNYIAMGAGGAQPNISKDKIVNSIIALPPLKEQKRIVAKIEELMPFVEQYAKASTRLNTLNAAFPEQMKKSILQQAVMGKLVSQNPNDEPASVLLKKIAEEKQKLIKEGKIKKQKALQAITEDEIPFDIPESWEWVRLEDVTKSITDGDHQAPPQTETGISFLVISNVSSGFMDFSNTRHVPEEYFEKLSADRKPTKGDILFTVTGSYGIPMKVETEQEFCFQRHIALIKPMIDANFLVMLLKSPLVKDQCDRVATGTAQKTVGLGSLRNILVPIPPVNEQIRILETLKHTIPLTESLS